MSAYLIARVTVNDPEEYKKYTAVTPALVAAFGGKFIVRGGDKITLEGPEETQRVVIIEFESMERAQEFYNSPEYQEALKIRQSASTAQFIIVDGVRP